MEGRSGVVICGAYGMGNVGDDAVLEAIVRQLRFFDKELPVTVLARQSKKTALRYGVRAIHPLRIISWLREMRKASLFISGGGTLLQDETSRRSLWYYLLTIRAAKKRGCAVQLYGCGIGPVSRGNDAHQCRTVLNSYADVICLRDEKSAETLRAWAVDKPRILFSSDPVFSLPRTPGARGKNLALILRNTPTFRRHVKDFAVAAEYARKTYGLQIVFYAFAPADERAARAVMAAAPGMPARLSSDPREAGRAGAVISMRLHGLIFALRGGSGCAGVGDSRKILAFCRENKLPILRDGQLEETALCALVDAALAEDGEWLSECLQRLTERESVNGEACRELLALGL